MPAGNLATRMQGALTQLKQARMLITSASATRIGLAGAGRLDTSTGA